MSDFPMFSLILAKQDFKFSCGHFTVFGADRAELLHGHNYQVAVELNGPKLDPNGLLIDFPEVKTAIRQSCARLDSRTLIPSGSPHLAIQELDDGVEVQFCDRQYRFPKEDVVLLPVVNTSIEVMAQMLWHELQETAAMPLVEVLGVSVSETEGQSCWYRAPLTGVQC